MNPDPSNPANPPRPSGNLEREESQIWRWLLGFMILLAVALTGLLWERLENIPYSLRAIPIGVLVLSLLFAVYAYGRRREVSELKGLLRGLQHVGAPPSEEQLDQLSQVILRSQRNFKELIDSFDDPACAVSLDGTLRTVNRRITELTGASYTELVGRKIYDLVEEPTQADVERGLGRFLEKRRWSGTVRIRLKNNSRPLYFECVVNGIIKGDEVVGASLLGRDVTEQREKELRFTELFETLQEGVYFSTPEGHLLDANPALVNILGYVEKRDLLAAEPAALNFDPGQPVLGRAVDDRGGVRTREIKLRRKDGTAASLSGLLASGVGHHWQYYPLPGNSGRHHRKAEDGAGTGATGRVSPAPAGKFSGSHSGGRPGRALYLREYQALAICWATSRKKCWVKRFQSWTITLRSWLLCTTKSFPARKLSRPRNTGPGIVMETGGRCAQLAAGWSMPREKPAESLFRCAISPSNGS